MAPVPTDQFEALFHAIPDGVTVQDSTGRLVYANVNAARIIGYDSVAALLQAPLSGVMSRFAIFDEEGEPFPLDRLPGRLVLQGKQAPEVTVRFRVLESGEERWSRVKATPIFDEQENVKFAVNIFHDVTELKQAEETAHNRARQQAAVAALGQAALAGRSLAALMDEAVQLVASTLQVEVAGILECPPGGGNCLLQAAVGWPEGGAAEIACFPGDGTLVGQTLASGKAAIVEHWPAERRLRPLQVLMDLGITSSACLLIESPAEMPADSVHLLVAHTTRRAFGPDDLHFLQSVANVLAHAFERLRAEEDVRVQREWFRVTLASIGDAVITTDTEGNVTLVNPVAESLTGWAEREAAGKSLRQVFRIVNEQSRAEVESPVVKVLREGTIVGLANHTVLIAKDGTERPIDDSGAPIRGADGEILGTVLVFRDVTERRRVEKERAALLEREQAARAAAEMAQQRLAFLAEAGKVLASSLDYQTTLSSVGRLVVPALADWYAIDVLTEDETIEAIAIEHVDPEKRRWAFELRERYPVDPTATTGVAQVLRTGQPEFYPVITDELLVAAAKDEQQLQLLRSIGFKSAMTVPLVAHGRTLGALTLVATESGRHFSENDLALAQELAQRVALAVDNARLYREAQEITRAREEALRLRERMKVVEQAERKFRGLLEMAPDAIVIVDEDGRIVLSNTQAQSLFGYSADELLGRPIEILFPERFRQVYTEHQPGSATDLSGAPKGVGLDLYARRKDGTEFPAEISLSPLATEESLLVTSIIRDVSARKEAERVLRESEERFRTAFTEAPIGMMILGPENRLLKVNRAFHEMLGYTEQEVLALDPAQIIHPEDLDEDLRLAERLFLGEIPSYHLEKRYITRDGKIVWCDFIATVVRDQDGKILYGLGMAENITGRKQAEEQRVQLIREQAARASAEAAQRRLAFLAEVSKALASSLDYEATLQNVARAAVPILADNCVVDVMEPDEGLRRIAVAAADREKESVLRRLSASYPPDPRGIGTQQVLQTAHPAVIDGLPEGHFETIAQDAEHLALLRQTEAHAFIVVPLIAREQVLGTMAFGMAESGRRYGPEDLALAEELGRRAALAIDNARLYAEAQSAIQLRDEFLSVASHELRTPLMPLQGYTELLERRAIRGGTPTQHDLRAIRTIRHQTLRLARLIDLLLDLSRLQTGRFQIERSMVNVGELARRAVEILAPMVEPYTIEMVGPDEPLFVEGDELRLDQVLQNLLDNAVKYTPQGGTITVRVERRGDHVALSVSDQGIGIPEEDLPRLFTRFYRANNVDSHQISGLGLGLHVVNQVVTLHGGTVEVESTVGQGSTFTVLLPLYRE